MDADLDIKSDYVAEGVEYEFHEEFKHLRIIVEWISVPGVICDLDVAIYCYDDRAHLVEKIDFARTRSHCDGIVLLADEGGAADASGSSNTETINLELPIIDKATTAMLVYVGGGPRNFNMVSTMILHAVLPRRSSDVFLPGGAACPDLFHSICPPKRDWHGVAFCGIYKNRWVDGVGYWAIRPIFEPCFSSANKEVDEKAAATIVHIVPALERFRPHMYPNVRAICSSLSSEALPKLKKKFQFGDGLQIDQFMEVIFGQLCEQTPKVMHPSEAPYTVAMLEEMFSQIDYNGDGACDWDEFTSFAIQQGLSAKQTGALAEPGADVLDEYVIEYREHLHMRDRVLSPSRPIVLCKYVPEIKRYMLVTEGSEHVQIFNDKFVPYSRLDPSLTAALTGGMKADSDDPSVLTAGHVAKVKVLDCAYLNGRDLFAYAASDHTIGIVKEQVGMGGRRIQYLTYNKIYSKFLHEKLCWSSKHSLLCTSATNRVIYGWDINGSLPIFHVSRHSDIITDFIAIDELDMFATCSMDKRIVLWAMTSRRVKAVLQHKRGIRCIDAAKNMLLSVGFELDAKVWDIHSKECVALLKGHRRPITSARLMCQRAVKEDEYRAISVDEMGEFRLWNIFLKEKSSRVYNAPVLQQFQMANPEDPIDHIRFVFVPNDPKLSTSNYSNVVGVGTKLLQFVPEKHAKEFSPATCAIFSETSAIVACGVKSALLKYDMSEGTFVNAFQNLSTHDLTALALDGDRCRRIYVGCGNGDLLIVNFGSGQILESHQAHSRDITKIVPHEGARLNIFTASLDGKLKMLEEVHGSLCTHNTVESAFGDNVGVQDLEVAGAVKAVVALSAGNAWGVWSSVTFKRIMVVREGEPVTAMAILGCSGDARDKYKHPPPKAGQVDKSAATREYLITVAISRVSSTVIYVVDCLEGLGSLCVNIAHDVPLYLTQLTVITPPAEGSINYALSRIKTEHDTADLLMIGGSDDGHIVFWNVSSARERAEYHFREQFGYGHPQEQASKAKARPGSAGAATAVTADTNEDDDASHNGSHNGAAEKQAAMNVAAEAAMDTYATFLTDVAKGAPIEKRTERTRMTDMRGWVSASEFGNVEDASSSIGSMRSVRMHKDSVNVMLDMADHGCMCTMAHDGYLRMVNLDMECLGEMALPNLTIKMKDTKRRAIVPFPHWRFILERMPIMEQHHMWAKKLVRYWRYQFKAKHIKDPRQHLVGGMDGPAGSLQHTSQTGVPLQQVLKQMKANPDEDYTDDGSIPESACALHESHQHVADLGDLTLGGALEGSMSQIFGSDFGAHMSVENVIARESILRDLAEPPVRVEGAPPVHIPTKLETKRAQALAKYVEFKARQKKRMQDKMSSSRSEGLLKLPDISTSPMRKSRSTAQVQRADNDNDSNSEATDTNTLPSTILADMAISAPDEDLWKLAGADFGPAEVPNAFSEISVNQSFSEGCIDQEAHRILRVVGTNENKADAFDRVAGAMLLRNPSMSTGVTVPELNNLRSSEVSFGSQKDMYSNADKLMEEKNKSSSKSLILSRHAIMCARIEQNVRKVGSMVHNVPPAAARELPMPDFSRKIRSELSIKMAEGEAYMQTRLMESAQFTEKMLMRRENDGLAPIVPNIMPDYARVAEIGKYIESKVGADINEEMQQEAAQAKLAKSRNKANEMVEGNLKDGLESKLAVCIRRYYVKEFNEEKKRIEAANKLRKRHEDMDKGIAPAEEEKDPEEEALEKEKEDAQRPMHVGRRMIGAELTNRMLAPSYKVSDIQTFLDIFLQVDTDFSGDLDIDEWVKLITKGEAGSHATMTKQQARMIFLRFDKKGDGYLSIRDLVPIVFGKASKEQMKLIVRVLEGEVVQKKGPTLQTVQPVEIDSLFEHYDIDSIGFVQLSLVRDRIRNMNLGDPIQFAFMETIKNMDDDDLVNSQEFGRLFKLFIVTDRRKKR